MSDGIDPSADPSPLFGELLHEQAAVEVTAKAKVIAAFHRGLLDQGVPEYEALELTRDFQSDFLAPIRERRAQVHDDSEHDPPEPEPEP